MSSYINPHIKVGRIKMTRKKCSAFTNRLSVGRPTYQGSTLPEDGHFDAEINNIVIQDGKRVSGFLCY